MRSILKYFRWLYVHSKGARWAVVANILLGTVTVGLNMAFILICKRLVDVATGVIPGHFWVTAGWAIAVTVVRLAVSEVNTRIENLTNSKLNFSIRADLYS